MGKLILIRHGETNKNLSNSLHGKNDPESLNTLGKEQIKITALRLKADNPTCVYSSKEKRAIESASIISQTLGLEMHKIDGLHERNWGIYAGKPWSVVSKILEPMTLEGRYSYIPENGESWKTFESRLVKAITSIVNKNKSSTVVVVTHGGAIRALMPYLLKVPREESFKYDPNNASLTIFNYSNGTFKKVTVNNTSHLKG